MIQSIPGDEIVRLRDLEWLDLSDLVRMDDEWRYTLAMRGSPSPSGPDLDP